MERLGQLQEQFVELACVLDVPVLGSSLFGLLEEGKCLEAEEKLLVVFHLFEVVDAETGVEVGVEVFAAVSERLELDNLRNFDILAKSIALVLGKVASVSDPEGVPADHLDLVDSIVDSVDLLAGLLLIEQLGFTLLFFYLGDVLHAFYPCDCDVVSVFVWVFDSVQESDQAFFLVADVLDHSFEGLFSVLVIHLVLAQICEVNSAGSVGLGPDELDIGRPAQLC